MDAEKKSELENRKAAALQTLEIQKQKREQILEQLVLVREKTENAERELEEINRQLAGAAVVLPVADTLKDIPD